MNTKLFLVGCLVLGSCLLTSAQTRSSRRIRSSYGDYDCSCTYHCPSYGIQAGRCYDNDYWGWGVPTNCCIPSYYSDYDSPDFNDNGYPGFYRPYYGGFGSYGWYNRR